jgi:hypothetical protein
MWVSLHVPWLLCTDKTVLSLVPSSCSTVPTWH